MTLHVEMMIPRQVPAGCRSSGGGVNDASRCLASAHAQTQPAASSMRVSPPTKHINDKRLFMSITVERNYSCHVSFHLFVMYLYLLIVIPLKVNLATFRNIPTSQTELERDPSPASHLRS